MTAIQGSFVTGLTFELTQHTHAWVGEARTTELKLGIRANSQGWSTDSLGRSAVGKFEILLVYGGQVSGYIQALNRNDTLSLRQLLLHENILNPSTKPFTESDEYFFVNDVDALKRIWTVVQNGNTIPDKIGAIFDRVLKDESWGPAFNERFPSGFGNMQARLARY